MRRRGFTLVELMIVIAIIGVAASLALTSARAFRRSGDLHRTAAEVAKLFRTIATETGPNRRPYKVTVSGTGLMGHASVVASAAAGGCAADFSGPTGSVVPPDGTSITPEPSPGPWVVDSGGALFRTGTGGTSLPTTPGWLAARVSNGAGCVRVALDPVAGVTVGPCPEVP